MNKVYIVRENDHIRAVFSTVDKAHKYREKHIEMLDDPSLDEMVKIESWYVDYVAI